LARQLAIRHGRTAAVRPRFDEERTMRDELDGRLWVDHGAAFGDVVTSFLDQLKLSLKRLHEIQFEAPWLHDEERKQG
jgi:hypothetical protein